LRDRLQLGLLSVELGLSLGVDVFDFQEWNALSALIEN
jgi:hypothetical protein